MKVRPVFWHKQVLLKQDIMIWFDFWCFNATFNNISAIWWRPVLVVEEAGVPGENHRPMASNWETLSLAAASRVESSAPFFVIYKTGTNPRRIGDRLVWVVRSNDLTHWATRAPNKIYITVKVIYVCIYKRLKLFVRN